jgi:SAM-dependent methyltransferase
MSEPSTYAAWYETARGAWIGRIEFALLRELLALGPHESVLDVGCGTGYFTTHFAQLTDGLVVGLDPNTSWLRYASARGPSRIAWVAGRGEAMPFRDHSFDVTVCVTALCFIADQQAALQELLRVTRRRFVLGLLNRHSILWWQKGRRGGRGGYRGARWHTAREIRELVFSSACHGVRIRSAILLPTGGRTARWLEEWLSPRLPWGGFLAVVGEVSGCRQTG